MNDALAQRCALAILLAALVATGVGLLAWGPVPLTPQTHAYADERTLFGLPNAWNALANLPLLIAGLLGLWAERRSLASPWARRSRQAFHVCAVLGALAAAVYHLQPGDAWFLAAHALLAAGFLILTGTLLGERVHPGFAGPLALAAAAAAPVMAVVVAGAVGAPGPPDLRPLLLLQIAPLLVVPTGALSLPGSHSRTADWLVLLFAYGAAKVFDLGDATILRATDGWISGHTLMHLCLAAAAAWLAYCTIARGAALSARSGDNQRQTSLNTSR